VRGLRESVHYFAQQVRDATPENVHWTEGLKPDYGILCPPAIGYLVKYVARRATPAGNFGTFLGRNSVQLTYSIYARESEEEAIRHLEQLALRYVITTLAGDIKPKLLIYRLHIADGTGRDGLPRLQRFRLVTEGPQSGTSIAALLGNAPSSTLAPYRLFEIVEGAVLEVSSVPGAAISAEVEVRTPTGRSFRYRAEERADREGIARLRVPYATDARTPARTLGRWAVRVGEVTRQVAVSEQAVLQGEVVRVNMAD
jgi:asparagine N-glycosylation enzyme membrane subunit Stt3